MKERTQAEKLAFTLRYLIKEGRVPGLLPKDVEAAAALLVEQEAELYWLRKALAAKSHIVEATAERENYQLKIKGTFTITDPRIYCGEIVVDDQTMFGAGAGGHDWQQHIAWHLTRATAADWIRELEERALVAVRDAIADATSETTHDPR